MIQFAKQPAAPSSYSIDDITGFLQLCWDRADPRDAITQHDEREMGNGPWSDSLKGKWKLDPQSLELKYAGEPAYKPWAIADLPLTQQKIIVYKYAWVCILNADGTFTVDRRD